MVSDGTHESSPTDGADPKVYAVPRRYDLATLFAVTELNLFLMLAGTLCGALWSAIAGAIMGYVAGVFIGAVFLIADLTRKCARRFVRA